MMKSVRSRILSLLHRQKTRVRTSQTHSKYATIRLIFRFSHKLVSDMCQTGFAKLIFQCHQVDASKCQLETPLSTEILPQSPIQLLSMTQTWAYDSQSYTTPHCTPRGCRQKHLFDAVSPERRWHRKQSGSSIYSIRSVSHISPFSTP